MKCIEMRSFAALKPLAALEEDEDIQLENHILECVACHDHLRALELNYESLNSPEDQKAFESRGNWEEIIEKADKTIFEDFEQRDSGQKVERTLQIGLSCTFCHDSLIRTEARYCASCLAPHHQECFREHGQCSALGCEETFTVSPSGHLPQKTPKKRSRSGLVAGLIICGALAPAALISLRATLDSDDEITRQSLTDIDPLKKITGKTSESEESKAGRVLKDGEALEILKKGGEKPFETIFKDFDLDHPVNNTRLQIALNTEILSESKKIVLVYNTLSKKYWSLCPKTRKEQVSFKIALYKLINFLKNGLINKDSPAGKLEHKNFSSQRIQREALQWFYKSKTSSNFYKVLLKFRTVYSDALKQQKTLLAIQPAAVELPNVGTFRTMACSIERQTEATILVDPELAVTSLPSEGKPLGPMTWKQALKVLGSSPKVTLTDKGYDVYHLKVAEKPLSFTVKNKLQRRVFEELGDTRGINLVVGNEIGERMTARFTKKPWEAIYESVESNGQLNSTQFYNTLIVTHPTRKTSVSDTQLELTLTGSEPRINLSGESSLEKICQSVAKQAQGLIHLFSPEFATRKQEIRLNNCPISLAVEVIAHKFGLETNPVSHYSDEVDIYKGTSFGDKSSRHQYALWAPPNNFIYAKHLDANICLQALAKLSGFDINAKIAKSRVSFKLLNVRYPDAIKIVASIMDTETVLSDGIFNISLDKPSIPSGYSSSNPPKTGIQRLQLAEKGTRISWQVISMVVGDQSSAKNRWAVLNDKFLQEGAEIPHSAGVKIHKIGPSSIQFKKGEKTETLYFNED
jgi:hypothetical protein